MKKYIFCLGIIMLALVIVSIKPTYGLTNEALNLNSNELLNYIEENNLKNIKKICTDDYCDYLRSTNIKRAVEIFKTNYEEYLREKVGEEKAREIMLKGFKITKIELIDGTLA
mgnify:FL=1